MNDQHWFSIYIRLEGANDVMSGMFVRQTVPDNAVKFCLSPVVPLRRNSTPEVASDMTSLVCLERRSVWMYVHVNFGDSLTDRS